MFAIVKIYVPELNDVIKHHSNVITIWRTSEVEVTALLKQYVQKWKMCKNKESIIGVRGAS